MNFEELVKEGIKESEIRHKKRLSEIAMGVTGRHKNILRFYDILKKSLEDYNYDYLIYLPCMPKSSAEIVSILSRKGNEPKIITPIGYKESLDKIKKLKILFDDNKSLVSNCELAPDKCAFYHGYFNFPEMRWKDEAVIIGDLLAEFIEPSEVPRAYVFMKMLRIPLDSVLSPLPNSKIYTGLIILIDKSMLLSNNCDLCNKIQISYRNLLKKLERNLQTCNWENLDMIDIEKENKKAICHEKPDSLLLPSNPKKDVSTGGNSDKIAASKEIIHYNQFNSEGGIYITRDNFKVVGQAAPVGPNPHAHDMNWDQLWLQIKENTESNELANDLEKLRSKMRQEATTAEQDLATGEVAKAQIAAKNGNGAKALEHLKSAGKWALSCSEKREDNSTCGYCRNKSCLGIIKY